MDNDELLIRVTIDNPAYLWLINHICTRGSMKELENVANKLAGEMPPNTIENLFEEEMKHDGYFDQFIRP